MAYDTPAEQDALAYDDARRTFFDLLETSMDAAHLAKWIDKAPARQELFDGLVVAIIRWPRALGRPDSPRLSDGFTFQQRFWVDVWHLGLDGSVVQDLNGWQPVPGEPDVARDNLAEPEHYAVRYLFHADPDVEQQLEVHFSDVPWRHPGQTTHRTRRYLSSHGFDFQTGGGFMALPPITVDSKPFFRP